MHHRLLKHMLPFMEEGHHHINGKEEALHIFQTLFTSVEAEVASELSFSPEDIDEITKRLNKPKDKLMIMLEGMAQKGLIYTDERNGKKRYSLLILAPGIMELQFMKGEENERKKEIAKLFDEFFEALGERTYDVQTPLPRVLPPENLLTPIATVLPYERVSNYIKENTDISISVCYCRHQAKLLGKSCGRPVDVCMSFGPFAKFTAKYGFGNLVNKKEALNALNRSEEAGLVHLTENCQEKINFICNCCGCCCYFMKGITKYNKPASVATSNYICKVDTDSCNGCAICVDRCYVKAISINNDNIAVVDRDRCIGCGVCMITCPTECMHFQKREIIVEPKRDSKELRIAIAMERVSKNRF